MRKQQAFTLIEILIALVIFAILGVMASIGLHRMIIAHKELKAANHKLMQLDMTMTLMRRDITQAIDRKVRDNYGDEEMAFLGPGNRQIIFTRAGLFNPFNTMGQSDMMRVSYAVHNGVLTRMTWVALDQPPNAKPLRQMLLKNVQSIQWQFIGPKNMTSTIWPPAVGANLDVENQSDLPRAVVMIMHVQGLGIIQGIFPVPARGVNAQEALGNNNTP